MGKNKNKKNESSQASLSLDNFPSLGAPIAPIAPIAPTPIATTSTPTPTSSTVWGSLKANSDTSSAAPLSTSSPAPTPIELDGVFKPAFTVVGTKKGSLPLQVEKRKHKTVTTLKNIQGDANALLTELRKALGTGGKIVDETNHTEVEIQGDHIKRISMFLCDPTKSYNSGGTYSYLKGVSSTEIANIVASTAIKSSVKSKEGKSISKLDDKRIALKQSGKC